MPSRREVLALYRSILRVCADISPTSVQQCSKANVRDAFQARKNLNDPKELERFEQLIFFCLFVLLLFSLFPLLHHYSVLSRLTLSVSNLKKGFSRKVFIVVKC